MGQVRGPQGGQVRRSPEGLIRTLTWVNSWGFSGGSIQGIKPEGVSWDKSRKAQVGHIRGSQVQVKSGVFYEDKIRYRSHKGSQVRQVRGSRVYS